MPISTEELAGGITRVILDGRLDIEGAAAVDLPMNVIAGASHQGPRRQGGDLRPQ